MDKAGALLVVFIGVFLTGLTNAQEAKIVDASWDAESKKLSIELDSHDSTKVSSYDVIVRYPYLWFGLRKGIFSLDFPPNRSHLEIVLSDGTVWLLNDSTKMLEQSLLKFPNGTQRFAWSPDGTSLATSASSKAVAVWNVSDDGRELVQILEFGHPSYRINHFAWSPDGSRIATGSDDDTAKIWDTADGKELLTIDTKSDVDFVTWHPNGQKIATVDYYHDSIQFWNASSGEEVKSIEPSISTIGGWSPSGNLFAIGDNNKTELWDTSTWEQNEALSFETKDRISSLKWSSDGQKIAVVCKDHLLIRDIAEATDLSTIQSASSITKIAWSPDDSSIAYGTESGEFHLRNLQTGNDIPISFTLKDVASASSNHIEAPLPIPLVMGEVFQIEALPRDGEGNALQNSSSPVELVPPLQTVEIESLKLNNAGDSFLVKFKKFTATDPLEIVIDSLRWSDFTYQIPRVSHLIAREQVRSIPEEMQLEIPITRKKNEFLAIGKQGAYITITQRATGTKLVDRESIDYGINVGHWIAWSWPLLLLAGIAIPLAIFGLRYGSVVTIIFSLLSSLILAAEISQRELSDDIVFSPLHWTFFFAPLSFCAVLWLMPPVRRNHRFLRFFWSIIGILVLHFIITLPFTYAGDLLADRTVAFYMLFIYIVSSFAVCVFLLPRRFFDYQRKWRKATGLHRDTIEHRETMSFVRLFRQLYPRNEKESFPKFLGDHLVHGSEAVQPIREQLSSLLPAGWPANTKIDFEKAPGDWSRVIVDAFQLRKELEQGDFSPALVRYDINWLENVESLALVAAGETLRKAKGIHQLYGDNIPEVIKLPEDRSPTVLEITEATNQGAHQIDMLVDSVSKYDKLSSNDQDLLLLARNLRDWLHLKAEQGLTSNVIGSRNEIQGHLNVIKKLRDETPPTFATISEMGDEVIEAESGIHQVCSSLEASLHRLLKALDQATWLANETFITELKLVTDLKRFASSDYNEKLESISGANFSQPTGRIHDGLSDLGKEVSTAYSLPDKSFPQRMALLDAHVIAKQLYAELIGNNTRVAQEAIPELERIIKLFEVRKSEIEDTEDRLYENPYVTGNPISATQAALFKGRLDLSQEILNRLRSDGNPTLLLRGPRRMGKSSFLSNLPNLLPADYIPVYFDVQGAATQSELSFFHGMANKIYGAVRKFRGFENLNRPQRGAFTEEPATMLENWIEEIIEPRIGRRTLMITLDEFESIGEGIREGKLSVVVLDQLRHMIQHTRILSFMFAGVRTLDALVENAASYFISVGQLELSYLNREEAIDLILYPTRTATGEFVSEGAIPDYDKDAVERILERTHCQPFLIQATCAEVIDLANKRRLEMITLDAVNEALHSIQTKFSNYFLDMWNQCEEDGQSILLALINSEEIPKVPDKAITNLLERGVINKENEGYKFEIPIVQEWMTEHVDNLS